MEEINRKEIISSGSTLYMTDIINDFFDLMHLEWSNNVGFKPKLCYYTQFKQDVDAEKYVLYNKVTKITFGTIKDGKITLTY